MPIDPPPNNPEPLQQRLAELERENAQLRADVQDMNRFGGAGRSVVPPRSPDAPFFRPLLFQRKLGYLLIKLLIPMFFANFLPVIIQLPALRGLRQLYWNGMHVFDFAGIGTWHPGIGIGLICFGGLSLGLLSIGGLGVGVLAFGGGSFGVIAIGGGSIGIVAIGGGACGYIAIGGGAVGYYALAQRGLGKYVFATNRQDGPAIDLFTRWFPSLRESLQSPMPVIQK